MDTKTLKVSGVSRFSSPVVDWIVLTKGATIRVSVAAAERLLSFARDSLNDNVSIPFFEEVTVADVDYDFTTAAYLKAKAENAGNADFLAGVARTARESTAAEPQEVAVATPAVEDAAPAPTRTSQRRVQR